MLSTVLVANRGEIACRIIRACSEAGLTSIAIYAENDAGSLFTELATVAVPLKGDSIGETYLNQQQISKNNIVCTLFKQPLSNKSVLCGIFGENGEILAILA